MSKKANFFWASYADLMTSLFFVMLVLFVLTVVMLRKQVTTTKDAIVKVNQVIEALQDLDTNYFNYDQHSMRYKLNIDIVFRPNDDDIYLATSQNQRKELIEAGQKLYSFILDVILKNPDINYLLVIEGNTQRVMMESGWNFELMPDVGYNLSYRRALSLMDFWQVNTINFREIVNCEVLICGSGYFGKSRQQMVNDRLDSQFNRRFTIQITPKIGKIEI